MAQLILRPESWANSRTISILNYGGKEFKWLSDVWKFACDNDIIQETYVVQIEPNQINDLRCSMNEVNDMYESGEHPEDLDFF